MGLLSKFNSFKVDLNNVIDDEDKAYVELLDKSYTTALEGVRNVHRTAVNETTKLRAIGCKDIDLIAYDWDKELDRINASYVQYLYKHFSDKYNVTLKKNIAPNKVNVRISDLGNIYPDDSKYYEPMKSKDILNDIFSQLGGKSFAQLMEQQIADTCTEECKSLYSVKGKIVRMEGSRWSGFEQGYGRGYYRCGRYKHMISLLDAIYYATYGKKGRFTGIDFLYTYYSLDLTQDQLDEGIIMPENKYVEKMKFFKNSRLDIICKSPELARELATKWMGVAL